MNIDVIERILTDILIKQDDKVDIQEIMRIFERIDDYIVFRYKNDAYFFNDNGRLVDVCPGYYHE